MAFEPGFYKIDFKTQIAQGSGVVVFADGKVRGGDNAIAYTGTYEIKDGKIFVTVEISQHTQSQNVVTVFGPDQASVKLEGDATGPTFELSGSTPAAADVVFTGVLTRLSD